MGRHPKPNQSGRVPTASQDDGTVRTTLCVEYCPRNMRNTSRTATVAGGVDKWGTGHTNASPTPPDEGQLFQKPHGR